MHQGAYKSIITYKEQFDTVLKVYQDQENAELDEVDVTMDFFDGLDNGCYAKFKKSILNGMTAGSVTQPAIVPVKRSAWIAGGIPPPRWYVLLTRIRETTKDLQNIKVRAKFEAIQKEI